MSSQPWHLKLGDDLEMLAPKGGAGALIYYQGHSEPETARFVAAFLKPGMTFWDVGAHIGEYSLLAAQCVGSSGRVHAFEPQPIAYEFLKRNVIANCLSNVTTHCMAVNDRTGLAQLVLHSELSMSFLTPGSFTDSMPLISVTTTSLDELRRSFHQIPDLIKVDVEGAERAVLVGGDDLLRLPAEAAPAWIMEIDESNCYRSGYSAEDLLKVFASHGFEIYWITTGGLTQTASADRSGAQNVLAVKRAREC